MNSPTAAPFLGLRARPKIKKTTKNFIFRELFSSLLRFIFFLSNHKIAQTMKPLQLNARLDNAYFLQGKQEIFFFAELKAAKFVPKGERAPLNISLVIDRSGSMQGDKLKYVKQAVDFVIQNLNSSDYLSIVQYDDVVEVVSPSARVTDKQALHAKVAQIFARNTTNLSGGMLEGYNQVRSTQKEGFVNRILLLSDGLANAGITEPAQLQDIARKQFRENRIGLSSFGVGADFNEELMTQLAEHGGANYYFIETPEQIPNIFARELSGLLSVVAQNTILQLDYAAQHLQFDKIYGYLAQQEAGKVRVNFNDVFSEEEKAIVIRFKVAKPFDYAIDFKVQFSYDDVVETLGKVTENVHLSLLPTGSQSVYQSGIQRDAVENAVFFVSNDLFQAAMLLSDQRQFDKAKTQLEHAIGYLKAYVEMFPSSEQLAKQLADMQAYLLRLPDMASMEREEFQVSQKMSKSDNYMRSKRKM